MPYVQRVKCLQLGLHGFLVETVGMAKTVGYLLECIFFLQKLRKKEAWKPNLNVRTSNAHTMCVHDYDL